MALIRFIRRFPERMSQLLAQNLRSMVLAGLFVAMGVVLQVFSIQLPLMRIGISPIPTIVSGILLGPVLGGLTGLLKDVVGFIVAPPASGSFFPPITVVQMLYGILPPLLLPVFRVPVDWLWGRLMNARELTSPILRYLAGLPASLVVCYLVVALTQFINGGLLMPLALNLLFDGQVTFALWLARFTVRIPQQLIFFAGYPVVTFAIVETMLRLPRLRLFSTAPFSRHS